MTPGERAYGAYRSAVGGKTFDGKPMLAFDEMPERIRGGWEAAAAASDRPQRCALTRGAPEDCSCTLATGCTYLGGSAR